MSTLIKLSQSEATNNTRVDENGSIINGDYTINLKEKTVLYQGDEVVLKNTFLDTRTEGGGRILIDDSNKEVSMTFCHYLSNHDMINGGPPNPTAGQPALNHYKVGFDSSLSGAAIPQQPSGLNYVMCKSVGGIANVKTLNSLTLQASLPRTDCGGGSLTFQYTDHTQNPKATVTINFPQVSVSGSGGDGQSSATGLNIVYIDQGGPITNSFKILSSTSVQENLNLQFVKDVQSSSVVSHVGGQLVPVKFTYEFTLPKGEYSPDTLAKKLTDSMIGISTDYNSTTNVFTPSAESSDVSGGFPTKTPFLTSIHQLKSDADFGMGVDTENVLFVAEDGQSIVGISNSASNNYLVGASQLSLIFDPNLNKFVFEQLNTDIISGSPEGQAIVQYIQKGTSNEFFLANKHSGIFFTSLSDIFYETLSFDPDVCITSYEMTPATSLKTFTEGLATTVSVPFNYGFQDGKNITGHLSSIDASVTKSSTFNIVPALSTLNNIASNSITSILAKAEFTGETLLKSSHYLVEISGFGNQDNIGLNKSVRAIISKYFTSDSYTMSGQGDSLVYKHVSPVPLVLGNLRVRILDAKQNNASDIGSDNVVFLQIERANPQ